LRVSLAVETALLSTITANLLGLKLFLQFDEFAFYNPKSLIALGRAKNWDRVIETNEMRLANVPRRPH
jgi:hypothetical protein